MTRLAVVLMNLGGPDSLAAVRPFLYNLFSDRAIIDLPAFLRLPLAWFIATRRKPTAQRIYSQLGGASPLLANTEAQAQALEAVLGIGCRCFVAMRYWHPLTASAVAAVKACQPKEIVLLPLYPQYSTTTTASSLRAWHDEAKRQRLDIETRALRSYPIAPGFITALARNILGMIAEVGTNRMRLLFSAHGLPLKIVKSGDRYPQEIEATAAAVVQALELPHLDWRICYQSRVRPLAWLGPSVDDELKRAGDDKLNVVIAPISFVSEHSETLVELDRDYRDLAERYGVPSYRRVPTVGIHPAFIEALAGLVREVAAASGREESTLPLVGNTA